MPILFSVYIDKLIKKLRTSKIGCSIGNMYFGIMVYADDIILLCPSRIGLQAMIDICQQFANEHNLQFSTNSDPAKSKTKCIHFSKKQIDLASIKLNGNSLIWVESGNHVGNILERDNSFTKDVRLKRGSFIGRVHSIMQEFYFANPMIKLKMISIYATSFYGSSLWNIFNGQCDRLYTAWNNAVRTALDLPRLTHRYLIESLTDQLHPQTMISSRFLKFHDSLSKCHKPCMRLLQELFKSNHQTAYCQNLSWISRSVGCKVENLTSTLIKKQMQYCPVPKNQQWRVDVLRDLQELKWNITEIDGFLEDEELGDLIENLAVS